MSYLALLPRLSFTINTGLTPQEISKKLSLEIEPHDILRNPYSSKKSKKRYEGSFEGETFKIRKIYTNEEPTFGTIFTGKIQGSTLNINAKLPRISELFMPACASIFLLMTIFLVIDMLKTHQFTIALILFPIASFMFYTIPRLSLKYEVSEEESFLRDFLKKTEYRAQTPASRASAGETSTQQA